MSPQLQLICTSITTDLWRKICIVTEQNALFKEILNFLINLRSVQLICTRVYLIVYQAVLFIFFLLVLLSTSFIKVAVHFFCLFAFYLVYQGCCSFFCLFAFHLIYQGCCSFFLLVCFLPRLSRLLFIFFACFALYSLIKNYAKKIGSLSQPRKVLITSYFGDKILLIKPLVKWYLNHCQAISKIYEFIPINCFQIFRDQMLR